MRTRAAKIRRALVDVLARLKKTAYKNVIESVTAVHVHHGLSKMADEWVRHAEEQCAKWQIPLRVERVYVPQHSACGIEAAARQARYKALMKVARELNSDAIFTAHHLDDRIETFLIQWIRGAGPRGLPQSAPCACSKAPATTPNLCSRVPGLKSRATKSPPTSSAPSSPGSKTTAMPTRAFCATSFATTSCRRWTPPEKGGEQLRHVPSRSWRSRLKFFPTWARTTACTAPGDKPGSLNIAKLLNLGFERQANCLRAWLGLSGIRSPSHAKLSEILRQLRQTHADTKMSFRIGGKELRRWGVNLVLVDPVTAPRGAELLIALEWKGEESIALAPWAGVLKFVRCEADEPGT